MHDAYNIKKLSLILILKNFTNSDDTYTLDRPPWLSHFLSAASLTPDTTTTVSVILLLPTAGDKKEKRKSTSYV